MDRGTFTYFNMVQTAVYLPRETGNCEVGAFSGYFLHIFPNLAVGNSHPGWQSSHGTVQGSSKKHRL